MYSGRLIAAKIVRIDDAGGFYYDSRSGGKGRIEQREMTAQTEAGQDSGNKFQRKAPVSRKTHGLAASRVSQGRMGTMGSPAE